MNFKRYHVSRNLFDYSTITTGYRIQWTTGNDYADATAVRSDYIPVNAGTYSCSDNVIVLGYDTNKNYLGATDGNGVFEKIAKNAISQFTISANSECKYIKILSFYNAQMSVNIDAETMLNTGSQPLPYEPYSSEVWHDTPHYIHNTSTDTITTLPAVIYANGTTATVGLKGQMEQNGTSTPDNPITPQGTGERTAQLFDISSKKTIGGKVAYDCPLTIGTEYTFTNCSEYVLGFKISNWPTAAYSVQKESLQPGESYIFTMTLNPNLPPGTTQYFFIIINSVYGVAVNDGDVMLNTGSTPLPYEPYGYKIPISSANITTPVYLGEVETTRKIKKLVLTGQESWSTYQSTYYITVSNYYRMYDIGSHLSVCSHYPNIQVTTIPEMHYGLGGLIDGKAYTAWNGNIVFNPSPMISSLTDWKSYLAQQYANGTPVTVWYVLATEETGIVNEPLMKIGDYADTVSGITIPTIAGANTLSVDTTLQPSEVTVNYHGWHPVVDVHEYDSNYTIATMQALTIAQLQTHTISDLQGGE